ncbi:MAG: hypothetical protein ACD_76C00006G0001, partial [uncultured bacterium]
DARTIARNQIEHYVELSSVPESADVIDYARAVARKAGKKFQNMHDYRRSAEAFIGSVIGGSSGPQDAKNIMEESEYAPREVFEFLKKTGVLTIELIDKILSVSQSEKTADALDEQLMIDQARSASLELARAKLLECAEVAQRFGIDGPKGADDIVHWALEHKEQIDEFKREKEQQEQEIAGQKSA